LRARLVNEQRRRECRRGRERDQVTTGKHVGAPAVSMFTL
jgi:hypothetical protein